MTAEALALAAQHLAASRRSVTRLVALSQAKAIARGLVSYLGPGIEAELLRSLDVERYGDGVDITWHAHSGPSTRTPWQPGTPLPELALCVTCTVSAPLREAT